MCNSIAICSMFSKDCLQGRVHNQNVEQRFKKEKIETLANKCLRIVAYLRECVSKYRTSPFFKRDDVYRGFLSPLSAITLILYFSLE